MDHEQLPLPNGVHPLGKAGKSPYFRLPVARTPYESHGKQTRTRFSLRWFLLGLLLLFTCLRNFPVFFGAVVTAPALPDLYEASVLELQAGLDAGQFTSVDLVKVCLLQSMKSDLSRLSRHTLPVSKKSTLTDPDCAP
jgi:hypothetical protein